MSQSYQYFWPTSIANGIALAQNVANNANVILNGPYAANGIVMFPGFTRKITITANGVGNFTITGAQNGVTITEALASVNNGVVTSLNYYDSIISIKGGVNAATAGQISVGTGLIGYLPLILVNTEKKYSNVSYALSFRTQAGLDGCTYTIYESLVDLRNNGQLIMLPNATVNLSLFQKDFDNLVLNQMLQLTDVCKNILVQVTSANVMSTLQMNFLQL
jgi:hypothetical protein